MSNRIPNQAADVRKPLVLVVEPVEEVRVALASWLSDSLGPCRVLTVPTGEACVETLRTHRPRAILVGRVLDGMGMGGIETTRRIKAEWPDVAVIILSLYDAPAYRSEALRAGASGYVLKSRVVHELLSCLRPLLRASALAGDERCETVPVLNVRHR